MRRPASLLLIAGLAWWVLGQTPGSSPGAPATLVAGLILLAGYVGGHLVTLLRLPRITGYLGVGVLMGPHVLALIDAAVVEDLSFLNELAVSFIALAAGSELRLEQLRQRRRAILFVIVCLTTVVLAFVSAAAMAGRALLPFATGFSTSQLLGVALLFGVLAVARSPSSALAVIRECRARGPFTETAFGVTVAMDVVVIILFALALTFCEAVFSPGARLDGTLALSALGQLAAGILLGLAVGRGLAFYVTRVRVELPVLMLGTAMLVTELSRGLARYMHESHDQALHLEPLLICVAAGFTVRNYSPAGERFAASLDIVHLPVFVLFFALAGAGLDLQALRLTWAAAAVLVLVRLVAIFAGAYLGGRCAGSPATANRVAGLAYLTQAGVSLGLAAEVVRRFPEWGETFATVVVAVITVNQVIGPIAMRAVLVRVGEARSAVVDAAAPEPGSAE